MATTRAATIGTMVKLKCYECGRSKKCCGWSINKHYLYISFSFSNVVAMEATKSVATGVATKHYFIYFPESCDCRDSESEL